MSSSFLFHSVLLTTAFSVKNTAAQILLQRQPSFYRDIGKDFQVHSRSSENFWREEIYRRAYQSVGLNNALRRFDEAHRHVSAASLRNYK